MNSDEIRRKVHDFRREYGLSQVSLGSLCTAFEKLGYTLVVFNPVVNDPDVDTLVTVLGLKEMIAHSSGFLYADHNYRLLFVSEKLSDAEKLLVLAHEIGHVICGHTTHASIVGQNVSEEFEANEFAHYLLQDPPGRRRLQMLKRRPGMTAACLAALLITTALGILKHPFAAFRQDLQPTDISVSQESESDMARPSETLPEAEWISDTEALSDTATLSDAEAAPSVLGSISSWVAGSDLYTEQAAAHSSAQAPPDTEAAPFTIKTEYLTSEKNQEHLIILQNNSDQVLDFYSSSTAYKANGTLAAISAGEIHAVPPGCSALLREDFEGSGMIAWSESTTDAQPSQNEPVMQDFQFKTTGITNGVIVSLTNTGENAAYPPDVYVLFFWQQKLVDSNYILSGDFDYLSPGETESRQVKTLEKFDYIEVYYSP